MQKRYIPIALLTAVLAAVAVVGYVLPEPHEAVPQRVLLDNAGGPCLSAEKSLSEVSP